MAAPIAHFDDDWSILGDLNMVSDQRLLPLKGRVAAPQHLPDDDGIPAPHDGSLSPGETGAFKFTEELVNDLDETLSVCFRNVNAKTDSIAPLSVICEDSLLQKDQ